MSIFSLFKSSPEKQLEKLRKKVKEPHGDASVREGAAQRLFEIGTPASLRVLLDRFTITVSPSVQDEREKETIFSWLTQLGEASIPPLTQFLKTERSVYWPARAISAILPADKLAAKFNEILRFHWENPPASAYPKAQIIRALEGVHSPELLETVRLFLEDEDDDVCLASIEYLLTQPEEEAREDILECYLRAEDRPRIRAQILEHLSIQGWTVRGYRPAIEETLPEGFTLTREGRVKRVGTA